MTRLRHHGPVRFRFSGDEEKAKRLTGFARGLLGGLIAQANRDNRQHAQHLFKPVEGVNIECLHYSGMDECRIYVAPDIKEEEEVCLGYLNGLLLGTGFENFTEKPGQDAFYNDEGEPKFLFTEGDMSRVPSEFSGTMAKVAQFLLGVAGEIPFSPTWYKTHGIFINRKDPDAPVPWIIRISAVGIETKKLQLCEEGYGFEGVDADGAILTTLLGGIPIPIKEESLSSGWTTLASAGVVNDFYIRYPLFYKCGWAFNTDGTAADNTCWAGEDTYNIRFHHYRINITSDPETGDPIAASMSEISNGRPKAERSYKTLWIPAGSGLMTDFDLETQAGDTGDIPIYVFYDGDDLRILSFINETGGVATSVEDDVFIPWYSGGKVGTQGFLYGTPGTFSGRDGTETVGTEAGLYMNTESQGVNDYFLGVEKTLVGEIVNEPTLYDRSSGADTLMPQRIWLEAFWHNYTSYDAQHVRCAAIPNGEREAVYTYAYSSLSKEWNFYQTTTGWNSEWATMASRSVQVEVDPCSGAGFKSFSCDGTTYREQISYTPKPLVDSISESVNVSNQLKEWDDTFEPYTVTFDCVGGPWPFNKTGWCGDPTGAGLAGVYFDQDTDTYTEKNHTHTLMLYRAGHTDLEIFSESETYTSDYGDSIKIPDYGNKWLVLAYDTKRLWAINDRISDLNLYSPDMDEAVMEGSHEEYPNTAGNINAWVGIPKTSTPI